MLNTTESTIDFTNRTTSGNWLINFPNAVNNESWKGVPSGAGILRDATLTPQSNSVRPDVVTRYPNHASLTLAVDIGYDGGGRVDSVTLNGDNVALRTTAISSFLNDRYPNQIENAKQHTTTYSAYDARFGVAKTQGDPNGRNTSWVRDPFGRVTSSTNVDGVITTQSYVDCPTGCGLTVYGVSPSFYIQTDSVVAPIRRTYFDTLGRPIYTETEPFSGTAYYKRKIKYDALGRVKEESLPYSSGASKEIVYTYDIRNRLSNVARPDGSNTTTVYTTSGNSVVVTVTDNVKNSDGSNADSQVKRSEYNILGQMTLTTDGYGTTTDPTTTYTYDAIGNVKTVVVNGGSAGTTTTTMWYDEEGNRTKIIGPDFGTITTTYTALGQLHTQLDNKGQLSTYGYDVLARITSLVDADGTSTWVWDTSANGVGKLNSRFKTGFTEYRLYDSDSRLKAVTNGITPIGRTHTVSGAMQYTYDNYGRPKNITYPGGFVVTRAYNARGYLSALKEGSVAIQTFNNMDAFGNSVDESYANGVNTLRTFDPETGRLTNVNTTKGSTVFQNNDYAWRSNGTLESRIANPAHGLVTTRKESYTYDILNRVKLAETYINGSNIRDLSYAYNDLGNITSKTSTLSSDTDVTGYAYGAGSAGPHAMTSANIEGISHTLTYDLNGAITKYDIAGTTDDKYIDYNSQNLPTKIVVGSSLGDSTPVAKDEFAYDTNGQRYARKTQWQEGGNTVTEEVVYIGSVEIISNIGVSGIHTTTKTMLSPNVMHVKMAGTTTEEFFEYAHRDHLGSIEVVTDENGNKLDNLAFEPFGLRKKKDWTANISTVELDILLELDMDHSRKARGFTGHEHLDRTGFIHMNGRIYDPVLGRFISPDPLVQYPAFSQSWNRYSYLNNTPTSFVDPTGFEEEVIEEVTTTGSRTSPVRQSGFISGIGSVSTLPSTSQSYDHLGDGAYDPEDGGPNACDFSTVACSSDVAGSEYDSHVTFTARFVEANSHNSFAHSVNRMIAQAGGLAATVGGAIELGIDNYVGAFSASLVGAAYRQNRVNNLARVLSPLKKLAFKAGLAGAAFELLGGLSLAASGDWKPFAVSLVGVGIGFAAGAVLGAPVALGVGVVYGVVDILGGFDPATYTWMFEP